MAVTGNEYSKMADQASPPSHKALNTLKAFLIGGLICVIGQGLNSLYLMAHLSEDQAKTTVSVTLIAITALLTAFGVFDKIAGMRGLVPLCRLQALQMRWFPRRWSSRARAAFSAPARKSFPWRGQ